MTDGRHTDISEDLPHGLEEVDRRRDPGEGTIGRSRYGLTPISPRKPQETLRSESDLQSAGLPAARDRTKAAVSEAAETLAEINKESAKAIIKASGLPAEGEPDDEPEPDQPIPEPDPEEPLPVPPDLDPGIVAMAGRIFKIKGTAPGRSRRSRSAAIQGRRSAGHRRAGIEAARGTRSQRRAGESLIVAAWLSQETTGFTRRSALV